MHVCFEVTTSLCVNTCDTDSMLCTGGRVSVDEKLNRQLYGSAVTADHILAGDVDAPGEMKPLYNIIHQLIVAAGTSI